MKGNWLSRNLRVGSSGAHWLIQCASDLSPKLQFPRYNFTVFMLFIFVVLFGIPRNVARGLAADGKLLRQALAALPWWQSQQHLLQLFVVQPAQGLGKKSPYWE
jgi:hypothetical protein